MTSSKIEAILHVLCWIFILSEAIRIFIYNFAFSYKSLEHALFHRDSFLFGAPSPFFLAVNASFIYRYVKDRLLRKYQPQTSMDLSKKKVTIPYEDTIIQPIIQ